MCAHDVHVGACQQRLDLWMLQHMQNCISFVKISIATLTSPVVTHLKVWHMKATAAIQPTEVVNQGLSQSAWYLTHTSIFNIQLAAEFNCFPAELSTDQNNVAELLEQLAI